MYWLEPAETAPIPVSRLARVTMIALAASIFFFGVYPAPILNSLSAPPAPPVLAVSR
jgi:NADH:ubiquinone oxidoreductase subunit 4 (subunit M)